MILNKTGRIIHDKPNLPDETPQDALEDAEEDVDEPGVPEDVIMLDEVAEFDNFIVWGHEAVPDERDTPLIRGVSEWLKFAEAVSLADLPRSLSIHG